MKKTSDGVYMTLEEFSELPQHRVDGVVVKNPGIRQKTKFIQWRMFVKNKPIPIYIEGSWCDE